MNPKPPWTLFCAAGALALGFTVRPAAGEFVTFEALYDLTAPANIQSVIVYARFSDPNDRVIAIGGTPQTPATAWMADGIGTFYQDPQGAPATAPFLEFLPGNSTILLYDTFFTIGTLTDSLFSSLDDVTTTPQLGLGFGDTLLDDDLNGDGIADGRNSVWFVTPGNPLGIPDQSLRVPIARLTSLDGGFPGAMILLEYESGGQVHRVYEGACFTIGLPCIPGDTNFDGVVDVGDLLALLGCWGQVPDDACWTMDLDGDGQIGVTDLLLVLGNWTPTPDPPRPVDSDLNGDGVTDIVDLLTLLACWGPVEPDCEQADFDGDGRVGSADLLDLLANWTRP